MAGCFTMMPACNKINGDNYEIQIRCDHADNEDDLKMIMFIIMMRYWMIQF